MITRKDLYRVGFSQSLITRCMDKSFIGKIVEKKGTGIAVDYSGVLLYLAYAKLLDDYGLKWSVVVERLKDAHRNIGVF